MYRYCYCKSMCKWYEIYMHDWWWLMMIDDWLLFLINIDDVCMLDSLWFYSVLGFLCFFAPKSEIPLSKWKFSHLGISEHFSMPVVDAPRHHLCCRYCSARTTIQLADDKCRRMASYDVVRGHDLEGTCPSCNGTFWSQRNEINSCVKPEIRIGTTDVERDFLNLHLFGILKASWARRC